MHPGPARPRSSRLRSAAVFSVVAAAVLVGCSARSGAPESTSSWTSDTDKALGSAVSSLGTAEKVLSEQRAGRLPNPYAAVALRDAVKVLQTETAAYLSAQPPASKITDDRAAVAEIERATTVLVGASVAGSSHDSGGQDRALSELRTEYERASKLQQKLGGS